MLRLTTLKCRSHDLMRRKHTGQKQKEAKVLAVLEGDASLRCKNSNQSIPFFSFILFMHAEPCACGRVSELGCVSCTQHFF